ISKRARKTNHVERFNCTLRQRVSRLVRATLPFSKKLSTHIEAIRYFICDYNLTKGAALPGSTTLERVLLLEKEPTTVPNILRADIGIFSKRCGSSRESAMHHGAP